MTHPDDTTTDPTNSKETAVSTTDPTQSYSKSFPVAGMTCGHCVASVTEELHELPSVGEVSVDLVAGGTSTVTVTSGQPLDDDAVKGAVEEAGYQLA
jgi:copper chaperone